MPSLKTLQSILFLAISSMVFGQSNTLSDSIDSELKSLAKNDPARLILLNLAAEYQTDPKSKLNYSDSLLNLAQELNVKEYLHWAYYHQGQAYRTMGDFDVAIYSFFKALDYAEKSDFENGKANTHIALADTYSLLGDHANSMIYYKKALAYLRKDDSSQRANILLNIGDEFYMTGRLDSALTAFEESKLIYQSLGLDPAGLAYNFGYIGLVKAEMGDMAVAEMNMTNALQSLNVQGDYYGVAIFLKRMSDVCRRKGYLVKAKNFADSSLVIAKRYDLKSEIRDNSLRLADLYAMSNDYESAYKFHQQYIALNDSLSNDELMRRVESLEGAFALASKQGEVQLLNKSREYQQTIIYSAVAVLIVLLIFVFVFYSYYRSKARINKKLEEQKLALEQLNQTKDKFFSIISHDLRGPISSFHGIGLLIKHFVQTKDTEQLMGVADDIDVSVDRLAGLLDNLLGWAMQQQGSFPYLPEQIAIYELISELIQTLQTMALSKGVTIINEVEEDIDVYADMNATMTIFRNLLR
jgi:two-component system NtrC family sensor kinase